MEIVYQAPLLNGICNILSILLGLIALGFGVHSVSRKGCLICCSVSLGSCGLSLLLQLAELNRLSVLADWSAIQDTLGARVWAGTVLMAACLLLNLFPLLVNRKA